MKSTEERSRFKNHFFKLGQGRIIPLEKEDYWEVYWKYPECSNDVFEVLTVFDVQTIRDQNLANFILLVRVLSFKLIDLRNSPNFPFTTPTTALETLNCVRMLTKILPILYELPNYTSELEDIVFWKETYNPIEIATNKFQAKKDLHGESKYSDKLKILAITLMNVSLDLLFINGFTLIAPKSNKVPSEDRKALTLWEPGIGSSAKYNRANLIIDTNRAHILKFILTLLSTSFYMAPSHIISNGSRFLTLLVATTPRVELLTLVCSLFNLICRSARSSSDENGLLYNNPQLTKMRHLCITYSAQLLTTMIVYPVPSHFNTRILFDYNLISTPKPYNMARLYVGKLHKESEILFLASYLMNILRTPLQHAKDSDNAKFSLNIKGNQPSLWATECVILLWELFQCNKSFKALAGQRYTQEITVNLLFYIVNYHDVPAHRNLVRVSSYFLLYLTSYESLMKLIVQPISITSYEMLPNSFKTKPRPTTFRDFLVIQICQVLLSITPASSNTNSNTVPSHTKKHPPNVLSTTLVEILYNLIPIIDEEIPSSDSPLRKLGNANPGGGISYTAASSITQLIIRFLTKHFLTEYTFHTDLLALIFRAVCIAGVKFPKSSRMLLFCILKNEKVYDLVWNTIFSLDSSPPHRLNAINDEDEDQEESSINSFSNDLYDSIDEGLSRVESHKSDQLSITPLIPKSDFEMSESEFIQSLSEPPSSRNSISSGAGIPTNDFKESYLNHSFDSETEAIEASLRPRPPIGMTPKLREKLPKDSLLQRSWGGNDALRIILTIIIPHLKLALKDSWSSREGSNIDSYLLVKQIEAINFDQLYEEYKSQINYDFSPNIPFEPLKFSWSHLSLGWYTSLLYGRIYNSIENVNAFVGANGNIMKNLSSSLASFSKLTSGWSNITKSNSEESGNESPEVNAWVVDSLTSTNNWAQTSIKLFKIEYAHRDSFFPIEKGFGIGNNSTPGTPGGVNDMTNSLVRRFSDFRMNNASRNSISSAHSVNAMINTPIEEQESTFGKITPRNSVTSLQSLNAINRSRTNTPRNSMSM